MRRKFQPAVFAVIFALFFAACNAPASETKTVDLAKVKPEIQAMEDAYAAAEKAKNADGVVAYYSDDAVSYNRNEEPLSGKAAIKERVAKRLAKDSSGNTDVYKVVDLLGDGDMLVEIGSWSEMNPAGAEVNKGHYMSVFKKQADGKYLCIRDMNVSSTPVKP
jgi:uncharacterized protein (TIGR02246 family)